MNAIPNTQIALNSTVQDLRHLGLAAKADLQNLSEGAKTLAEQHVINPSVEAVRETRRLMNEQAKRSIEAAKVKIDHLRGYIEENPVRSIAGALTGGVILGLLLRR